MKFSTPYNHDRKRSAFYATENHEETMTQQNDAAESDINVIVSKYLKTNQLPQLTQQPMYADFTDADDFRAMQDKLRAATEAFESIPASLQKRFNHDPAEFVEFCSNKDNQDELRKLGLADPEAPPPKEPEPIKVIVTNPSTPA